MARLLEGEKDMTFKSRKSSLSASMRNYSKFLRREDGGMINFSLFLFLSMLVVSGLSVDLMRHELQRSRLQSTLDRALLAAAHPDQQVNRKEVVMNFFAKAGLAGFIDPADIKVTIENNGTLVTADAKLHLSSPLLSLSGINSLAAPAQGGAAKLNDLTEISLVVDVSGSMGSGSSSGLSKIVELRNAATSFSNLLLCNPNDPDESVNCTIDHKRTSLSLVPYSTQVVVGSTILPLFQPKDEQTIADLSKRSYCATFKDDDFKEAGVAPGQLHQSARFLRHNSANDKDKYKPEDMWSSIWNCPTDDWREIVAFEDSAADMASEIAALRADGNTAIDIGLKWGTALLRHEAMPVVDGLINNGVVDPAFSGRPYNPQTRQSSKYIVLMTDGENTAHQHNYDGYRTGPSPFWLNKQTGVISVWHPGADVLSDHDDQYFWYSRKDWNNQNSGLYDAKGEYQPEPFGYKGKADCMTNPVNNGNYLCTTYKSPQNTSTINLTYEQLWSRGYTWRFFSRFIEDHTGNQWLGKPGRSLGNGSNGIVWGAQDQRLIDQCNAAKDAGITIYTIEVETPSTASDAMVQCASIEDGERLSYKVGGDGLVSLFEKIASDINKLRLVN